MKETDFHFDTETLESGRRFFTRPCNFMLSVANLDQLPPSDKDEIAFVGRSNVGKSSLINALFNDSLYKPIQTLINMNVKNNQ